MAKQSPVSPADWEKDRGIDAYQVAGGESIHGGHSELPWYRSQPSVMK